jgi:hypothetical protein
MITIEMDEKLTQAFMRSLRWLSDDHRTGFESRFSAVSPEGNRGFNSACFGPQEFAMTAFLSSVKKVVVVHIRGRVRSLGRESVLRGMNEGPTASATMWATPIHGAERHASECTCPASHFSEESALSWRIHHDLV